MGPGKRNIRCIRMFSTLVSWLSHYKQWGYRDQNTNDFIRLPADPMTFPVKKRRDSQFLHSYVIKMGGIFMRAVIFDMPKYSKRHSLPDRKCECLRRISPIFQCIRK